jgi:hypothetical protein
MNFSRRLLPAHDRRSNSPYSPVLLAALLASLAACGSSTDTTSNDLGGSDHDATPDRVTATPDHDAAPDAPNTCPAEEEGRMICTHCGGGYTCSQGTRHQFADGPCGLGSSWCPPETLEASTPEADAPTPTDAEAGTGDDGPNDAGDDAPSDSGACEPPNVWHYKTPGCGAEAHGTCGPTGGDACAIYLCGCDGELVIGCDDAPKPFRHVGLCGDAHFPY